MIVVGQEAHQHQAKFAQLFAVEATEYLQVAFHPNLATYINLLFLPRRQVCRSTHSYLYFYFFLQQIIFDRQNTVIPKAFHGAAFTNPTEPCVQFCNILTARHRTAPRSDFQNTQAALQSVICRTVDCNGCSFFPPDAV